MPTSWEIAEMCANIIKAQGLSPTDNIMVGATIINILGVQSMPVEEDGTPKRAKATPPSTKKTDPLRPQKIIASPGETCTCSICGKHVYTIGNVVYEDGMKISEFLKSFTPVAGAPELTKDIEIQNVNGNIRTDCPLCRGQLSLNLIGRPSVTSPASTTIGRGRDVSVGSMGGEEFGE